MKLKAIFTFSLILFFSFKMFSEDKVVVNSKLEEAKIFFNGAELVHSAKANLQKGDNEIRIEGLSPNIDRNSLKIKTNNGVIVSSFEFSMDYLADKEQNPQIKKLKEDIEKQQKLLEQLETEIRVNNKLLTILQKSTDKNIAGTEEGLSIDELIKTMDYYKTKSLELEKALSDSKEKKDQIMKTISGLRAQFDQESIKNNKMAGILKINLSSPNITSCDFLITYYTFSAGWMPYYDINVASTDSPVRITTKAKVHQVTGLDWDKVKISLSTAVPGSGKVAPLFSTWFLIYIYRNTDYGDISINSRRNKDMMMQNSYSYDGLVMEELAIVEDEKDISIYNGSAAPLYVVDGVTVSEDYYNSLDRNKIKSINTLDAVAATNFYGSEGRNGAVIINLKNSMDDFVVQSENQLNITFDIDIPYSIPGNGKEQNIDLKNQEVNAVFKYYSAPKLDSETYLLAEIADWQKLNLLNGSANITYDGTYVGETYINAESTHANLSLSLGTDRRVVVKREKQRDYSSTKFLGNDVKQEFSYLLTVRNNQNKDIKMVLKDQYPISTTKEISVEFMKDISQPTFNIEDMGVVTWEFDMKPGEVKTFRMVYNVKYPKDKELNL